MLVEYSYVLSMFRWYAAPLQAAKCCLCPQIYQQFGEQLTIDTHANIAPSCVLPKQLMCHASQQHTSVRYVMVTGQ